MSGAVERLAYTAGQMLIVHRKMVEKGEGHYGLGYGLGGGSSLWDDLENDLHDLREEHRNPPLLGPCYACKCGFSDIPRETTSKGRVACVDGAGCLWRQQNMKPYADARPAIQLTDAQQDKLRTLLEELFGQGSPSGCDGGPDAPR